MGNTTQNKGMGNDLTTGSIPRLLFKFSLPLVAQMSFVVVNSFVGAILLGKFVGSDALGVVAMVMPIIFVLNSIAMGFTTATSILISQAFGRKDFETVKKNIDTSFILVLLTCLICIVVGIGNIDFLLAVINTPPEMLADARLYLLGQFIIVPFLFFQFLYFSALRGIGESKSTMFYQIIGVVLNLILAPLFICGIFGLPKLGVLGAVLAMGLAQLILDIVLFIDMKRQSSILSLHIRGLVFDKQIAKLTVKIGVPTMIQQVILNASSIFIIGFVNQFGHIVTAGFGAASRIDFVAFMPAQAICMSVSMMAGQNIGAQKLHRVKGIFCWGLVLAVALTLIPAILAYFIPETLMRIFINDASAIAVGVVYLKYLALGYVLLAITFAAEGIPLAAGQTWVATIFTLIGFWFIRIPIAYYLIRGHLGVRGVWIAILLGTLVGALLSVGYFISGRWKQKALVVVD